MLFETPHVRVTADDGIATLWLSFPGAVTNRLSAVRLGNVRTAIRVVRDTPGLDLLAVRSGKPGGFCDGFDPAALKALDADSEAAAFTAFGQRVLSEFAELPQTTLAFLEGPCVGPGLELALACDYRLAVARPDSWIGFGDQPTCWGGTTRLTRLIGRRTAVKYERERFTAREAAAHGVIDQAFCQRRGKIELRSWLNRLQRRPGKRVREASEVGLATERRTFRVRVRDGLMLPAERPEYDTTNPVKPLASVGLIGERNGWLAAEFALQGCWVRWVSDAKPNAVLEPALRRGRVTPLEAQETAARISTHADADCVAECDLVVFDDTAVSAAGMLEHDLPPWVVVAVPPGARSRVSHLAVHPERVFGMSLTNDTAVITHDEASPDALAAVSHWFDGIGCHPAVIRQPHASRILLPV